MQYAFSPEKCQERLEDFLVVILLLSTLAVVATATLERGHRGDVVVSFFSCIFCRFFRKGIRRCDGRSRRVSSYSVTEVGGWVVFSLTQAFAGFGIDRRLRRVQTTYERSQRAHDKVYSIDLN